MIREVSNDHKQQSNKKQNLNKHKQTFVIHSQSSRYLTVVIFREQIQKKCTYIFLTYLYIF